MAPLELEGVTLGEKHRYYNSILKTASANQGLILENINYEDSDIDNLLKIDVASSRRDVKYILNVLTCDDMLYVSRAINRITWLITENQYADVINPQYLYKNLFPKMSLKAKNKLLLTIRLKLKDVSRVEGFYNFYKNDIKSALKWLPGCSPTFIENVVSKHANNIGSDIIKRLCENSFEIFKIYCKAATNCYNRRDLIKKCSFLLNDHTNEFLDIFESLQAYERPKLGKRGTQAIMKNCPERVISKFSKYYSCIDVTIFAKNLKKDEVQTFLLKQKDDDTMKNWFKFDNIKHFVKYLPKENRFQLVKSLTMDNSKRVAKTSETQEDDSPELLSITPKMQCAFALSSGHSAISTNAHIYRWYRFAPFNVALTDLKKLINVESNPSERNAILTILIKSAGSNQRNIQTLLDFYRERHVNEPFKFKIQFVNTLLSATKTHLYDENTWNILNDIFSSMEVYMESDNNVPFCIQAIIVYKILHNQKIPEIIEKKFSFSTFKEYRKKLNVSEQNILFSYLYDHIMTKLNNQKNASEAEMATTINVLHQAIDLISDWNKNIVDYPVIIDKIKELIQLKKLNSWDIDLTSIYTVHKKLRRLLFEESFVLHPSDEACVNALKHDPELLLRYKNEIQTMLSNDSIYLSKVLRKLRIYWPRTMAQQWHKLLLDRLSQIKGQKTVVRSLCIILPRHLILPLIEQHAPVETKINWVAASDTNVSLKKNIAKNMHLVRSSINLDTVLLYAKGDYLIFACPSLCALLYNMSSVRTSDCIMKLLDAPVSLQKHGIRTAFHKLEIHEIKEIIQNVWNNTKNSSIKTVLFQQTFKMLCKEKNATTVTDIWQLMSLYIESLSSEENRIIYNTFGKVQNVPIAVRPAFFTKGYLYLKSLPDKAKCDGIIKGLDNEAKDIIHLLEPSFIEDVLLESVGDKIVTKNINAHVNSAFHILSSYLLNSKTEEMQILKYKKLLVPILENSFATWEKRHKGNFYVKNNTINFINQLMSDLATFTVTKKNIVPVKLFKEIENKFINGLSVEENYSTFMSCHLTTLFVGVLDSHIKNNPVDVPDTEEETESSNNCTPWGCGEVKNDVWNKICSDIANEFGKACLTYLKQETYLVLYPTLFTWVAQLLMDNFASYNFSSLDKYHIIKSMLSDEKSSTIYCIAIEIIRSITYDPTTKDKAAKKEIRSILKSNPLSEVKIHMNQYLNSRHYHDYDSDIEDNDAIIFPGRLA